MIRDRAAALTPTVQRDHLVEFLNANPTNLRAELTRLLRDEIADIERQIASDLAGREKTEL
jgi:hypothetical protein